MLIIGMHDWLLYTGEPTWRETFTVAIDRVRQGPLYRGSLFSEKRRESKKLAVMDRWQFCRDDRSDILNCIANIVHSIWFENKSEQSDATRDGVISPHYYNFNSLKTKNKSWVSTFFVKAVINDFASPFDFI